MNYLIKINIFSLVCQVNAIYKKGVNEMEEKKQVIRNVLRKLGVRSHNVMIKVRDDVASIYVDHEYFGIWSFTKNTFVD